MTKDKYSQRYQLTINNPEEHSMSHDEIKKILTDKFKTLVYFCLSDEKGTCHHTHVFICFSSRVRFSMVKRYFPSAHIEQVKGTVTDNIDYIKKTGKWENDIKHGTRIEGTFEEFGTPPANSNGERTDLTELYEMVLSGMTNAEIISHNQDYILQIDKLDKLRTIILTEQYKGIRRLELTVTYVYGISGSGKTRSVLDEFGDANVYRVTDYQHPFDGYNCEPVLVFEEFRSSLRLSDMLEYLDIYPIELPARYSNKYACYLHVFIISNWELERQFSEIQKDDPESWNAFLRRVHRVKVYTHNDVLTYASVKEYFDKKKDWHTPLPEEDNTIKEYFPTNTNLTKEVSS